MQLCGLHFIFIFGFVVKDYLIIQRNCAFWLPVGYGFLCFCSSTLLQPLRIFQLSLRTYILSCHLFTSLNAQWGSTYPTKFSRLMWYTLKAITFSTSLFSFFYQTQIDSLSFHEAVCVSLPLHKSSLYMLDLKHWSPVNW